MVKVTVRADEEMPDELGFKRKKPHEHHKLNMFDTQSNWVQRAVWSKEGREKFAYKISKTITWPFQHFIAKSNNIDNGRKFKCYLKP